MSYVHIILFNMFSVRFFLSLSLLLSSPACCFVFRWDNQKMCGSFHDDSLIRPYSPIDNIISSAFRIGASKFELLMAFDLLFFSSSFTPFAVALIVRRRRRLGPTQLNISMIPLCGCARTLCTVYLCCVIIFFYFLLSTLWQSTNFILTTNKHTHIRIQHTRTKHRAP